MSAHCTVHVQISLVGKSRCRQQVETSGQRIFATGRIVAGARKLPLPLWIRAPRGSLRAPGVRTPNGISIGSYVFVRFNRDTQTDRLRYVCSNRPRICAPRVHVMPPD